MESACERSCQKQTSIVHPTMAHPHRFRPHRNWCKKHVCRFRIPACTDNPTPAGLSVYGHKPPGPCPINGLSCYGFIDISAQVGKSRQCHHIPCLLMIWLDGCSFLGRVHAPCIDPSGHYWGFDSCSCFNPVQSGLFSPGTCCDTTF